MAHHKRRTAGDYCLLSLPPLAMTDNVQVNPHSTLYTESGSW